MTESIVSSSRLSKSKRNDVLKLIAIITMLIDHIGYIFFPEIRLFRTIGRIAFPIFAYQLAVGYKNTSSLPKYSIRLFGFALISYIPYIYFAPTLKANPIAFNVMFLLLAGIGAIKLWELSMNAFKQFKVSKNPLGILAGLVLFLVFVGYILTPELLSLMITKVNIPFFDGPFNIRVSYGTYGLLLMMIFYWFEHHAIFGILSFILVTFISNFLSGAIYVNNAQNIADHSLRLKVYLETMIKYPSSVWNMITTYRGGLMQLEGFFFQARAIMGVLIIYLLKNQNFTFKMNKYVSYWFYPVHMTLLILIKFGMDQWGWQIF